MCREVKHAHVEEIVRREIHLLAHDSGPGILLGTDDYHTSVDQGVICCFPIVYFIPATTARLSARARAEGEGDSLVCGAK